MCTQHYGNPERYTKRHKVIRDLVHDYIHLTAFEMDVIDTPEFQRLRDITQVTTSSVFPNANHTRFEHSLGTFELTRRAIEAAKDNGLFIDGSAGSIHSDIEISTLIAALLHDIGHCPFSHLGEQQFNRDDLITRFGRELKKHLYKCEKIINRLAKAGANHEKLSCLVILEKLWEGNILGNASFYMGTNEVKLNLEHILRCILGVTYCNEYELPQGIEQTEANLCICNFCIKIVNGKAFDMDSLDYIIRDAIYCGLSSKGIDTKRLFSNMYISKKDKGSPAFKRQAESVLKDIIDQKNCIYLYAIYHHAVLYSNFMYEFIFRRFKNDHLFDTEQFFSANAVINDRVSDERFLCLCEAH